MNMNDAKYLVIDIDRHWYKAETGWTTQKKYAKQFTEEKNHSEIKKLRKNKHLNITFERVEVDKKELVRLKHLEAVKKAVKHEITGKKEIIQVVETANIRNEAADN